MAKVTISNASTGDLILPNGALVPAGGDAQIDADAWAEAQKHPVVKAWIDEGRLSKGTAKAEAPADAEAKSGKAKG